MGLVYLNNKEERIYEAYGMTVYGKQDRYTWSIYPDQARRKCIYIIADRAK